MVIGEDAITACDRLTDIVHRSLDVAQSGYGSEEKARAMLEPRIQLIRYVLATLKQRIRPALAGNWQDDPPHVVTFGATNTGKSTVLNILLGRPGAAMSELARYSQHPVAFSVQGGSSRFLTGRFVRYERFTQNHPPRQSDEELKTSGYRPALGYYDLEDGSAGQAFAAPASSQAVFWDMPDYSTEEALYYMDAVFDTIALADLVVMVVTNESYANAIDKRMRGMIADSGVPIRVVANKLLPGSNLLEDIKKRLGDSETPRQGMHPDRIHPLPVIRSGAGGEAVLQQIGGTPEASAFRSHVEADVDRGIKLKKEALSGTVQFIHRRFDEIFAPLQEEADIGHSWVKEVNHATQQEFYERYKKEYLDGQLYSDFNLAFLKALDYLEVPGVGTMLSMATQFLKGVTGFVWNIVKSPFTMNDEKEKLPEEQKVLQGCYEHWLIRLQHVALQQNEKTNHPEWARLAQLMGEANFQNELAAKLGPAWKAHRERMQVLIDERAKNIYGQIEEKPLLRNSLRTVKFTADTVSVGGAVIAGGLDPTDFVIGPGVAILLRLVYEKGGEQLAESQKQKLKQEQLEAFKGVIDEHMVEAARALFRPTVRQDELHQARADCEMVREAGLALTSK